MAVLALAQFATFDPALHAFAVFLSTAALDTMAANAFLGGWDVAEVGVLAALAEAVDGTDLP